jgi:hypothetical protein
MSNWVKLTSAVIETGIGNPIYVDLDRALSIHMAGGKTVITWARDTENTSTVQESCEEIFSLAKVEWKP